MPRSALLKAFLIALLLAGCGGSDEPEPQATAQPAGSSAFVTKMQAWCAAGNTEAKGASARLGEIFAAARAGRLSRREALRETAAALDDAIGVLEVSTARLHGIAPPAPERRFHADLLGTLEESERMLRRVQAAARKGDRDTVNALFAEVNATEARRTLLLQKHPGLEGCAVPTG